MERGSVRARARSPKTFRVFSLAAVKAMYYSTVLRELTRRPPRALKIQLSNMLYFTQKNWCDRGKIVTGQTDINQYVFNIILFLRITEVEGISSVVITFFNTVS